MNIAILNKTLLKGGTEKKLDPVKIADRTESKCIPY
jgi:hypothetical protein